MSKYQPTQGDWVEYCAVVLKREEKLRDMFYSIDKDPREWRNFLAWFRRRTNKEQ